MSELHEKLLQSYGTIGRRTCFAASYLAANGIVLLIVADATAVVGVAAFAAVAFAVAMVVAHGAYETIMPLHRRISAPHVVRGFKGVVGNDCSFAYEDLRALKHELLQSNAPQQLKSKVKKDLALRQQLTYVFSTTLVAVPLMGLVALLSAKLRSTVLIELAVAALVLVLTTVGHLSRSHALGRSYGRAWRQMRQPPNKAMQADPASPRH